MGRCVILYRASIQLQNGIEFKIHFDTKEVTDEQITFKLDGKKVLIIGGGLVDSVQIGDTIYNFQP